VHSASWVCTPIAQSVSETKRHVARNDGTLRV
jgi:hypothetical protein